MGSRRVDAMVLGLLWVNARQSATARIRMQPSCIECIAKPNGEVRFTDDWTQMGGERCLKRQEVGSRE